MTWTHIHTTDAGCDCDVNTVWLHYFVYSQFAMPGIQLHIEQHVDMSEGVGLLEPIPRSEGKTAPHHRQDPSAMVFTRSNDGWTDLCIKLWSVLCHVVILGVTHKHIL